MTSTSLPDGEQGPTIPPPRRSKTPVTPPGARRNTLDTVTTADDGAPADAAGGASLGVPDGVPSGAVGTADGAPSTAPGAPGLVVAVSFEALRRDAMVQALIKRADAQLGVLGYTEHGQRHTSLVANIARNILQRLHYPERTCELAAVAGYLHDIGNCVNRRDHATAGALMARDILLGYKTDVDEVAVVMGAIGNHEETTGDPVGEVSAALNIADKADVHRSRVREIDPARFDIHDRVNYASQHSFVRVDGEARVIELEMSIDTKIAPLMDYFEIFLNRMTFIRRAVTFLECEFRLSINRQRML
jgi:putative nucleotidyltransferase with HDIG domain